MIFISESRLVFKVKVNGIDKVVNFSEQGATSSSSTYETDKPEVITAIRSHKFYRDGKIREIDQPKPEVPVEVSDEILEFASFSQLKVYLKKNFGADAQNLKTPPQVKKFAREHGVNYRFSEL